VKKDLASKPVLIWFLQNALPPANERKENFKNMNLREWGQVTKYFSKVALKTKRTTNYKYITK